MTLNDLYQKKGELVTQIEVAQAQLQSINQQIVNILNDKQPKQVISNGANGEIVKSLE